MTRRELAPGDFFVVEEDSETAPWMHLSGRVFCVVDSHSERDYFRGGDGFDTIIGDAVPGITVRRLSSNLRYGIHN